ncbi:MAG: hypothetical protein ACXWWW_11040, partial [Candidatus Deferrimicrobiaceae bacterium]
DRKYYYTVLNTVEKRDFATNRVLKVAADLDKSYYTIQVSSDGKKLYLGGGGDTILIYDSDTMKLVKRLDTPGDAVLTHFRVQKRKGPVRRAADEVRQGGIFAGERWTRRGSGALLPLPRRPSARAPSRGGFP